MVIRAWRSLLAHRGRATSLADSIQSAVEAVWQRMVSGNAVSISLHATGVAAEHLADERIARRRPVTPVVVKGDEVDLPVVQEHLQSGAC